MKPIYLKSLYLKNFRSYSEAEFYFSPKLNVIYGGNATGKTNLLEAIYLLATGRSFRTQSLFELIRENEPYFLLEARLEKDLVEQKISLFFDGQNKLLQLDSGKYSSFHPLLGILPCVLHTPYDIELIMGAPSERRRFCNLHLAQSDPTYVHHLTRFWKAMKQRNTLLRRKRLESIECWEKEMALSAQYITSQRDQMIEGLKAPLEKKSKEFSEEEMHNISLQKSASNDYLKQLEKNRNRELELGLTLAGPHRDDLLFSMNQKATKLFASEGQKKTALAILKLAEWERLCQRVDHHVIIGFDDLDQHLDSHREAFFRQTLTNLGQAFITTPHLQMKEEGHVISTQNFSKNCK